MMPKQSLGLKLTTGNADTLWVSGYTTEEWIAPVVNTSVTNLVTLGSDMNVIPTLFKSLQTDKSPVNDYDVVNKKSLNDLTNIKTYSQLSQIGLSGGVLDNSPYAIGNALPANSMLIVGITGEGNTYNYPSLIGNLTVVRANTNHVYYEITTESGNGYAVNYVLQFTINTASEGTNYVWKRVLTDVDTGYWQPNETVTRDTVRKLVGKQYAGCFLVCKVAGTTGSTQPSPDPADGAGIGGGSGSITFYSSLEEIGITPGQESFASIHNALPINSVLEYAKSTLGTYNDSIYPGNYGYFKATKHSNGLTEFTYINYVYLNSTNNVGTVYSTYYNTTYPNGICKWNKHYTVEIDGTLAKQSDLTDLSNSVVKSVNGIKPINGNVDITGVPTGTILPFAGSTIPSGFLACNGAAVSRTTYSALFIAISTKYGSGNGSSTFNVPQIEDNRFLEFSGTAGGKRNAGLPNITGDITDTYQFGNMSSSGTVLPTTTGAFSASKSSKRGTGDENSYSYNIHFNAKNSNAIYGASTTVQPKSLTVRAIIKY